MYFYTIFLDFMQFSLVFMQIFCIFALKLESTNMKVKDRRIEAIKMLISSKELCCQEEVMEELVKEGFKLTQATLSRDLKQLKVAKASSMNGKYVYVLPNETMYKRVTKTKTISQMLQAPGFVSINYSQNIGVIKTRPGYASAIAYNIDNSNIPDILGTIAGDDTIITVLREGARHDDVTESLAAIIPNLK